MIAGIVLAAGAGTRFGGRKQLAELDGRPLLEHALEALESAPVADRIVVLGADAADVAAGV
ncbi:MAG: molybdenum cofactor cytidylyltransferase, partial [Thermoleophilales bacterium]|nr:molybdenum cofactor cytidylyltransferase [Thermoleophilales bacterium]